MTEARYTADHYLAQEAACKTAVNPLLPVIVRVDGVRFSTYTKHLIAPADTTFMNAMDQALKAVFTALPQTVYGFVQSDEASVLILPSKSGDLPLAGQTQKLASIAAAAATAGFNARRADDGGDTFAMFDGRVFNVGWGEAGGYFRWRQRNGWSNAMNMTARTRFTHRELMNVGVRDARDKLMAAGTDPDFTPPGFRFGRHLHLVAVTGIREYVNHRTGLPGAAPFSRRQQVLENAPGTGLAEFVDTVVSENDPR